MYIFFIIIDNNYYKQIYCIEDGLQPILHL